MKKEENPEMNRRDFVVKSSLAVGTLAATMVPNFDSSAGGHTSPVTSVSKASAAGSQRSLGALKVSALGFGCMNLAGIYKPATSQKEAVKVLRGAYENGITFFDTAQSYG